LFITSITFLDLILSLLYAVFIYFGAGLLKPRNNQIIAKYFKPFILFKIVSAILFVLIHVYIYRGGDTFLYFRGGEYIGNQLFNNPNFALSYWFSSYDVYEGLPLSSEFNVKYIRANDVFFMSKLTSVFTLLSFNQLMATNVLFSLFSAVGIWKLFETLCNLYPMLSRYFAFGILFYPTIGIWGSGILKDPIALSAIGLIFFSIYQIYKNRKILFPTIIILICIKVCIELKPYILYTFVPVMLLWLQGNISKRVKNNLFKFAITPIIIGFSLVAGYFFLQTISESAGKYSLDNVQSVAEGFHSWHSYLAETRDQSGYSLGEVEFTVSGILQKTPEAIFVTFYRPFLFTDVRNAATAFEAIQSFILLLLTIYVIYKVKLFNFIRILFSNNDTRSFILFALVFGISVGLTSYNFGALSRYKIPCLPFFNAALTITYYLGTKNSSRKRRLNKLIS